MRPRAWHLICVTCLALATAAKDLPAHTVHLEIRDALTDSELEVSITRKVAAGTSAVDFMEEVVELEYRRYPGVGVFVTSLCGVKAPRGAFWALSVDGERTTKGISELSIERPVRIRWDLVNVDAEERPDEDQ